MNSVSYIHKRRAFFWAALVFEIIKFLGGLFSNIFMLENWFILTIISTAFMLYTIMAISKAIMEVESLEKIDIGAKHVMSAWYAVLALSIASLLTSSLRPLYTIVWIAFIIACIKFVKELYVVRIRFAEGAPSKVKKTYW